MPLRRALLLCARSGPGRSDRFVRILARGVIRSEQIECRARKTSACAQKIQHKDCCRSGTARAGPSAFAKLAGE
jgi:hypothetical protein